MRPEGELLTAVATRGRARDGDLIVAVTGRRVRSVHAQLRCHLQHAGFTSDGLRPQGGLWWQFVTRAFQYRFERISATEVERIDQWTGTRETFGPTPNAKGEYIHIKPLLRRLIAHETPHGISGVPGREVWFGGREDHSHERLDLIWPAIEAVSAFREADDCAQGFPWGRLDMRHFLPLRVNDGSEEEFMSLVEGDEARGLKRKWGVRWRNLPGRTHSEAEVLDLATPVDGRTWGTYQRAAIVRPQGGP